MQVNGKNIPLFVHLDLKGAPPKIHFLRQMLPLLKRHSVSGLLIEYEDMFPYQGHLSILASHNCYRLDEIKQFVSDCLDFEISIVPLVQTFGHMEFVLKHATFAHLRESQNYPNSLCPSKPDSFSLVSAMIDQIVSFHQNSSIVHIGCDEVYQLGICADCQRRMSEKIWSKWQLFSAHVNRVTSHVKSLNGTLRVLIWDDMLRGMDKADFCSSNNIRRNFSLNSLVEPVVWFYGTHGFPDVWTSYSQSFGTLWGASAFKGATGPAVTLPDSAVHVQNQKLWLAIIGDNTQRVQNWGGFILTGWSRYDHFAVMCELLPAAIPSLVLCLVLLNREFTEETHRLASVELGMAQEMLLPIGNDYSNVTPAGHLSKAFPGSNIWLLSIQQTQLFNSMQQFFHSHLYSGWFHKYNVSIGRVNIGIVSQLLDQVERLVTGFEQLQRDSNLALTDIFDLSIASEWIEIHCNVHLIKLKKIDDKMRRILSGAL